MSEYKAILIAEDDQELAQSLERSFLRRGYETRVINSLSEADSALKKFHPNFAIVDLKIKNESGLQLIKTLHQFDPNIKIVMLTGYASISTTIEAIKLGACYYLAKPVNVDEIILAFDGKIKDAGLSKNKKTSIKNLEWEHINQALSENNFNIAKTARALGMHRRTLSRKLDKRVLPN